MYVYTYVCREADSEMPLEPGLYLLEMSRCAAAATDLWCAYWH